MTWDILVSLGTFIATLTPIFSMVLRLNRSLVALEEAVKQLRCYMEKQSSHNHRVTDSLMDHERRLVRLETQGHSEQP